MRASVRITLVLVHMPRGYLARVFSDRCLRCPISITRGRADFGRISLIGFEACFPFFLASCLLQNQFPKQLLEKNQLVNQLVDWDKKK